MFLMVKPAFLWLNHFLYFRPFCSDCKRFEWYSKFSFAFSFFILWQYLLKGIKETYAKPYFSSCHVIYIKTSSSLMFYWLIAATICVKSKLKYLNCFVSFYWLILIFLCTKEQFIVNYLSLKLSHIW